MIGTHILQNRLLMMTNFHGVRAAGRKRAAWNFLGWHWNHALNRDKVFFALLAQYGYRVQQANRVGMLRVME
jgi:hypothetical protein